MEKNFDQKDVKSLFDAALAAGKCHNQKDFAALAGINESVMSSILKGIRPVSDTMYMRIKNAVVARGVTIAGNQNAIATAPNATATAAPSSELIAEMRAQREMYAAHIDRLLTILEKSQK